MTTTKTKLPDKDTRHESTRQATPWDLFHDVPVHPGVQPPITGGEYPGSGAPNEPWKSVAAPNRQGLRGNREARTFDVRDRSASSSSGGRQKTSPTSPKRKTLA